MLPLAILCGGLGTRMRPLTEVAPKPMLDVNGEPFLGHLLRSVARNGITDVVLLIGYLGEQIVAFAGDGASFGLKIQYVWDGERPLGTAGAVRRALPHLGKRFLVSYGDAYLHVNYADVVRTFEQTKPDGTHPAGLMTVYAWSGSGTTEPNTAVDAGFVTCYDKDSRSPHLQYVDYGLSAFDTLAFAALADGQRADLAVVNKPLIAARNLIAYQVDHLPLEIGSPNGLKSAQSYLRLSS